MSLAAVRCTLSVYLLTLGCLIAAVASAQPVATQPSLDLVVLGSGGPGATGRAGSSYLVLVDGTPRILVDAGPGSFARLGESKLSLAKVDVVLLTHLHVDHAGDLPGLFKARAVSSRGPIHFRIFGPGGAIAKGDDAEFPATSRFVDLLFGPHGAFSYLRDFSAPMTFEVTDLGGDRSKVAVKTLYSDADLVVSSIAGHHRDAPAIVYRIDHAGKSITFNGDIDADGLSALLKIAKDTSLLVFNTVVLDPPGSSPVLYTLHTPPQRIGEVAETVHAGKLLLSHLSPSVEMARDSVSSSIGQHYQGATVFAEDGMRLTP